MRAFAARTVATCFSPGAYEVSILRALYKSLYYYVPAVGVGVVGVINIAKWRRYSDWRSSKTVQ